MAESTPKSYSTDPNLWLYTSLTAGSSHIITATSRLETILKANRIPFKALDVATDEKARMLWGRRAGKRKLPGLMRMGELVGDLEEIEEWNEFGELKQRLNFSKTSTTTPTPSAQSTPSKAPVVAPQTASTGPSTDSTNTPAAVVTEPTPKSPPAGAVPTAFTMAMKAAGVEAAAKAAANKSRGAEKPLVGKGTKDETIVTPDADGKLADSAGIAPPVKTAEASEAKVESEETPAVAATSSEKKSSEVEPEAPQTKEEEFTKAKEEEVAGAAASSAALGTAPLGEKERQEAIKSTESLDTLPIRGKDQTSLSNRRSSVEPASEEEIKHVEASTAIPEETQREEEEEAKDTVKHDEKPAEPERTANEVKESVKHDEEPIKPESIEDEVKEPVKHDEEPTKPESTQDEVKEPMKHDEEPGKPEGMAEEGAEKTQEQPAAKGDLAGETVAD